MDYLETSKIYLDLALVLYLSPVSLGVEDYWIGSHPNQIPEFDSAMLCASAPVGATETYTYEAQFGTRENQRKNTGMWIP